MSDNILKGGQAKKSGEFLVEARRVEFDTQFEQPVNDESVMETETDDLDFQLPSDVARSEAEKIIADAESEAQEIIEAAKLEALNVKEEAEEESQQLMAVTITELEARKEALEKEIRQELETEYRDRYRSAIVAVEAAAKNIQAGKEQYVTEIERPALELVMEIAKQLLGSEIHRSPEFLAGLIGRAMGLLKPEHEVTISVDPATFMLLSSDDMLTSALRGEGINPELADLSIDESLKAGQFIVTLGARSIEYNLDQRIKEMMNHIESRADAEMEN